jgi:hypothetical protein
MRKEMPVIPVNKMVDPKRIIGKKWRAEEEEERHKGSLTKKKHDSDITLLHRYVHFYIGMYVTATTVANPTIVSHNASAVKISAQQMAAQLHNHCRGN